MLMVDELQTYLRTYSDKTEKAAAEMRVAVFIARSFVFSGVRTFARYPRI
jgi:hypothetical protein